MEAKGKIYTLLRKSERYFKTDMIYMASGSFWMALGQIMGSASALITVAAFAYILPPSTYGQYKYILTIAGVLSAFSLTGMTTAVTQSVAKGFDGALMQGWKTSLKWSAVMIFLALSISIYYFIQGNLILAISIMILGFLQPLINSSNLYSSFLTGKKLFKKTVILYSFRSFLIMGIMVATILYTQNVVIIILVFFLSQAIISTTLFYSINRKHNSTNLVDNNAVSYSKHLSAMNVLNILMMHIDKILVFHYLGAVELAIYSFASIIPEQVKTLVKSLSQIALPKFSERKTLAQIKVGMRSKTTILMIILSLVTVLYVLIAPAIYTLILPKYISAIPYSQILALSFIALVGFLPESALTSQAEQRALYILQIGAAIFQLILLLVLLHFYGLWGIVFARILSKMFNTALAYFLFYSRTKSTA